MVPNSGNQVVLNPGNRLGPNSGNCPAGDIPRALAAVVQAVSNGAISADEGAALSALIAGARQAFELAEIDLRLKALEGKLR